MLRIRVYYQYIILLYHQTYSIGGLWVQLHEEHSTLSDSLEKRYGSWERLCVLFQLVYHGCEYSELSMPLRQGDLFDPETIIFWLVIQIRIEKQ